MVAREQVCSGPGGNSEGQMRVIVNVRLPPIPAASQFRGGISTDGGSVAKASTQRL